MPHFDVIFTLTPAQRERLAQADIADPQGVVHLEGSTSLDDLAGADMLVNARTFLTVLAEAPAPATKTLGNLPRRFVERVVEEMRFPPLRLELLRSVNKRLDEEDVPELHVLRVVLGLAGLVKKRSGHFSVTRRGERLAGPQNAGELWAVLVRTYFGRFNIFYRSYLYDDPLMQRHIAWTLWWIRARAERPASTAELASVLSSNSTAWMRWGHDAYLTTVAHVLLEPMEELGLLSRGSGTTPADTAPGSRRRESRTWQTTELFRRAVCFDLGPAAENSATTIPPKPSTPTHPRLRLVPEPGSAERVVTLHITLKGIEPAIWRRLEVPADATLERLHMYLNTTMGWMDYHLHEFMIGQRRIGMPDDDWMAEYPCEDETAVTLAEILTSGSDTHGSTAHGSRAHSGPQFLYRYDLGDDWEHRVTIEGVKAMDAGAFYPRCTDGARACPPEDCGGSHGYAELLQALADPRHPDHDDMREWSGGPEGEPYDPEAFDLEGVNRLLRVIATGTIRDEDWDHFLGE